MQQTPNPLAHDPALVPPLLVHSDLKLDNLFSKDSWVIMSPDKLIYKVVNLTKYNKFH